MSTQPNNKSPNFANNIVLYQQRSALNEPLYCILSKTVYSHGRIFYYARVRHKAPKSQGLIMHLYILCSLLSRCQYTAGNNYDQIS